MIQRTISGRGKGFFSSSEHPELHRGPLSLPFNDYSKFFRWRQSNSGVKLTIHLHLEPRLRKSADRVLTLIRLQGKHSDNFTFTFTFNIQ
jgi:hypothetical protein